MHRVDVDEAAEQFSYLLKRVDAGEEVVLMKAGDPVARLLPYQAPTVLRRRKPGRFKGQIWIAEDFDEPLEGM